MSTVETGDDAQTLHAQFAEVFGYPPSATVRAPGRVNLIGEHTDYNGGLVLPIAIDRAVTITIGRRGGESIRIASNHRDEAGQRLAGEFRASDLAPGSHTGWLSHPAGVVFEIGRTTGEKITGVDLLIDSTVPVGAGLSSSHALEVGVLIALEHTFGLELSDIEKVLLTQRAENDFVGAPTGIVDQAASIMAEAGHALFLDCRDLTTRQIPFELEGHGLGLMVIDTRVSHSHSESGYGDRRRTCEEAASVLGVTSLRELRDDDERVAAAPASGIRPGILTEEQSRRVRHVLTENTRVRSAVECLKHDDFIGLGRHLLASHESLSRDYEVSCPELDTAVEAAMGAGALGARMTGGGFGGSAIALVDLAGQEAVGEAVTAAFAAQGYRAPDIFVVGPGPGAGLLAQ